METVYKFCGKHGIEILSKLELKVTPPNQFNDPFEFTPRISNSDFVSYCKGNLDDETRLKEIYPTYGFPGDFHAFQEWAKNNQSTLIGQLHKDFPNGIYEDEKSFLDDISKLIRVLCMSGERDKILMWGHYCDTPLGLVIGFDRSCAVFQEGIALRPVEYVKQRICLDLSWEEGSPEMERFRDEIVFRKSEDLLYEKEFRKTFVHSSPSLVTRAIEDKCTGYKSTGYFFPFPAEAVVSVTLGPRVSAECENDVREVLQTPHFSKVILDRAILNQSNCALEFEPVK